MLDSLGYTREPLSEEAQNLSNRYIQRGVMPPKSTNDALHLAIATVSKCVVVLSWNFKHMVNLRTMTTVDLINMEMGYAPIQILSPGTFLEGEG